MTNKKKTKEITYHLNTQRVSSTDIIKGRSEESSKFLPRKEVRRTNGSPILQHGK